MTQIRLQFSYLRSQGHRHVSGSINTACLHTLLRPQKPFLGHKDTWFILICLIKISEHIRAFLCPPPLPHVLASRGTNIYLIIGGNLEVKLRTVWTDEKAEAGRAREEERRRKKIKEEKESDEDAGVRKGRKVAKHYVFPMICGSGGSKSRLAKAAGAEPAGQMRDEKVHGVVARHISKSKCTKHLIVGALLEVEMSKKCTPLWCEAHFEVQSVKNWRVRGTFGSWAVEKAHGVVARSTFPNQNAQSTPASEHFWKLRCSKSARRCGAKHVGK